MYDVIITTDGSSLRNGRKGSPGGFAAVIQKFDENKEVYDQQIVCGRGDDVTNNMMELNAVIAGLERISEPSEILVRTDSQYVSNAFNKGWICSWKSKNWKTSAGVEVKNLEYWQYLIELINPHTVRFRWVMGHNGDELNELCDYIADIMARDTFSIE